MGDWESGRVVVIIFFIYFIKRPICLNLEASESAFLSHQLREQSETTSGKLAKCLFKTLFFKEPIHLFFSKGFSEFGNRQLTDGGGEGDGLVSGRGREKFTLPYSNLFELHLIVHFNMRLPNFMSQ